VEGIAGSRMGIQFTETMRGFVTAGAASFEDGAREEAQRSPCEFTLTVTSEDLTAMLSEPSHRASLAGTLSCPLLSTGALSVSNGVFELFPVATDAVLTRRMKYSFSMTAGDGRTYRFSGFKSVHDDPGADMWADTTTLFVDIARDDGTSVAKGVLRILPADFAVQMTTLRVLRAPNLAAAMQATARFAKFFAGTMAETYLGLARAAPNVWPPASRDAAPLRPRRALRLPAPEAHPFRTADGVDLRLTRHRGDKGPVMLVHGLGVSSRIFTADTIDTNLAEYLAAQGYDVWLLDFRASVDLRASHGQFTGDDVARFDYPAAVETIRAATGAPSVQVVAHCFGASTLFMALAAGLRNVRSAVFSQVAGHVDAPLANELRAGLRLPTLLKTLGIDALTTDIVDNPDLVVRLYDRALALNPVLRAGQRCDSVACHRISFMYAPLYRHEKLNEATHENVGDLFGIANLSSLDHLSATIRARKVVASDGGDIYLPAADPVRLRANLANFRFPIRFVHGGANECFLPSSTERTLDVLRNAHPDIEYDREVIPGYGHIDCIFGAEAARDVYPHIAAHLAKTA
jgi:cholesterol oxidase